MQMHIFPCTAIFFSQNDSLIVSLYKEKQPPAQSNVGPKCTVMKLRHGREDYDTE